MILCAVTQGQPGGYYPASCLSLPLSAGFFSFYWLLKYIFERIFTSERSVYILLCVIVSSALKVNKNLSLYLPVIILCLLFRPAVLRSGFILCQSLHVYLEFVEQEILACVKAYKKVNDELLPWLFSKSVK